MNWLQVLSPLIDIGITFVAGFAGLAASGLLTRFRVYLDAKGHAEASKIVSDASDRIQAAMQNSAGQIALQIQAGRVSPTDLGKLRELAADEARKIGYKLPDSLAALKPTPDAVTDGVLGKVAAILPPPPAPAPALVVAGASLESNSFQARASIVKARMMQDLALADFQAAGAVGNLGEESGLVAIQEVKPISGRGGFGWGQWTGSRRVDFEAFCKSAGLSVTDPEANYKFLIHELQGPEQAALDALRATTTLEEATRVFEDKYERAGVVRMDKRLAYANLVMQS